MWKAKKLISRIKALPEEFVKTKKETEVLKSEFKVTTKNITKAISEKVSCK